MAFNTVSCIVFFVLAAILYHIIPGRIREIYLLAVSYIFVWFGSSASLVWLLVATAFTYAAGIWIGGRKDSRTRKSSLAISLAALFLLLGYFKYLGFAAETAGRLLRALHLPSFSADIRILAPLGISYYTFLCTGYLIDIYRGKCRPERNVTRFALYTAFFPKFLQGPIERADHFLAKLQRPAGLSGERLRTGLVRMLYGYFLKMVIADNAAVFVNTVFSDFQDRGSVELTIACLFFAVQIYCDFAGYSHIALGMAKVLGYDLLENFDTPYMALSVAEFWRRWHISLTLWFKEYLYIPLGGNRKGRIRKYINIMAVFFASGLWHGASWHFVFWGCLNGFWQVAGDILAPAREKVCGWLRIDRNTVGHRIFKGVVTFILIDIAWVFFRADSVSNAAAILSRIVNPAYQNPWIIFGKGLYKMGLNHVAFHMLLCAIGVMILVDVLKWKKIKLTEGLFRQSVWIQYAVILFFLLWTLICGRYGSGFDAAGFIYTQF